MTYEEGKDDGENTPVSIGLEGDETSLQAIDEADRESWREEMRRFRDRDEPIQTQKRSGENADHYLIQHVHRSIAFRPSAFSNGC
jgi:hypothetical protein